MMGNACGCAGRKVGSAAAWTALAIIEANGADFYQVREVLVEGGWAWLAMSQVVLLVGMLLGWYERLQRTSRHHAYMVHSRKDRSEEEPGGGAGCM